MRRIVRTPQPRMLAAALFSSALLIGAVPAVASASFQSVTDSKVTASKVVETATKTVASTVSSATCAVGATSTPFAQFGDSALYTPLAGGSFESGAPGWSLTNSSVVSGNESYNVAGGSHSLAIQPTGVAVSPSFCINTTEPSFRFFLRQTSGSWAVLNVTLLWSEGSGPTHETTVGSLQTGTSWQASPVLQLATTLPLTSATSSINAKLEFHPEQSGGAWAIDDVYVDPHSR
jgi:hypothetical protein